MIYQLTNLWYNNIMVKPAKHRRKIFIAEYLKSHNATKAVLKAYPDQKKTSAAVTGSNLLREPNIKRTIDDYLAEAEYTPTKSIASLINNETVGSGIKCTAADSIRASELLLKLSGKLVDRKSIQTSSINMSIDVNDKHSLLKLKSKYDKLLNQ